MSARTHDPHEAWSAAMACAGVIAATLLAVATTTTLWDRDEPRFAQAAVEMRSSGNYLLPTFNRELRPQKPPFVYWLMTLSLGLFGQSELAVRMWSPVAIGVAALATFAIGRRLWSARVGWFAMIVLTLTPLTMIEGTAATADAVLLAALTVGLAIVSAALVRAPSWKDAAWLGLALGVGALTKGPVVAIALPISIIAVAFWLARDSMQRPGRAAMVFSSGAILALLIFAAWFVPANAATAGQMAARGLIDENIGRVLVSREGHGTPMLLAPFYYPAVIVVGFLPWVAYLPAVIRRVRSHPQSASAPANALLLAWASVPLVAFTFSATKLPHYVFPIWPALALGVGVVLADRFQASQRFTTCAAAAGATVALIVGLLVAPVLERLKPVPYVTDAIRSSDIPGPLFVYLFEEPSLLFYGGRPLVPLLDDLALTEWARQEGRALLVAPRAAVAAVEQARGSLGLRELASRSGWNYVKGDALDLVAFVRSGDR